MKPETRSILCNPDFNQLRDDQMIYVGPSKRVSLEWIMNVTGGHRIVLAEDLPEPLPTRRPRGSQTA